MTQNIQWTKPVCQLDADHLYIGQTTADLDIMARDGSYLVASTPTRLKSAQTKSPAGTAKAGTSSKTIAAKLPTEKLIAQPLSSTKSAAFQTI